MTNYPSSQDNNITLPGVSGSSDEDVAINALREAAFAIEKELGITPSGVYSDVRARLDILEARINDPGSGIVLSDGYTNSPFFIVNTPSSVTLSISDGYGVPTENRINGSLFMRADGYANNELYIRRSGNWYPIQTDLWVAGGDLIGSYTSQTVVGLDGYALNTAVMSNMGATHDGYHLTFNNSTKKWEPQTGFIPGRDLAIYSGPYGRTGQTVVGIQNRNVSSVAPVDGYSLVWVAADNQWEPQVRAILFDGYTTRTNLVSNKFLQSPIDNTKVGIINFGSRSTGATTGATANYAAILSGDRNVASAVSALVVGGDVNTSSGNYATVVGGTTHTASGLGSFIGNGNTNTASAQQAAILDGYSNVASAVNAFVINGGGNQANANFSGVLGGISNVITLGATHAGIGWGSSNSITAAGLYGLILGGNGNQLSAQNAFVGNASGANVQSAYAAILAGLSNTISAASSFATILNGSGSTATGGYATILNANTGSVNGLHALVLNGSTNSVIGSYSTIANGSGNTISGSISYGTILDGYSNTVSSNGGFIGDGYSNSVSGIWSTVLNGNNNSIASGNTTILNGSSNTIDAASPNNVVLFGTANGLNSSSRVVVAGNGNTFTNVTSAYILGQFNSVQGNSIKITGDSNTVGASSSFNRVFGNSNTLGTSSVQNSVFGASNNLINSTHDNIVLGSSNIVDGYGNQIILGATNTGNSNFGLVFGQYGKSRMFGQQVQASSRFTAGTVGQAQWSRVVLSGTAAGGAAIQLLLQDNTPTPMTFQDGYSYDLQIRVLVVNTSNIGTNPVVPARFVFDVLAHQESGTLIMDHISQTLVTTNTSDDPTGATRTLGWSVTVAPSGGQLQITVDPETGSANYVQPGNTPSTRRAIATVEMREITRL